MAPRLESWSVEKVLAGLKLIYHQDVSPPYIFEKFDRVKYEEGFREEEKLRELLKEIYDISKGKLEIYGTVDEMIESLRKVAGIPNFITYTFHSEVNVSANCASLTIPTAYSVARGALVYYSKNDIALSIFKIVTSVVRSFKVNEVTFAIFTTWHTAIFNNILRGLKGSFDFIRRDSQKSFILQDLANFKKSALNIEIPEEAITFESFSKLRAYFNSKDVKMFDSALRCYKDKLIADSDNIKKTYAQIIFLIENITTMYKGHSQLFIPFTKIKEPLTVQHDPVIRVFTNRTYRFYLSREIRNAMEKPVITNKLREKCKSLVLVESEEERKNGIVYATQYFELLEIFDEDRFVSDADNFIRFVSKLEVDYQNLTLPIISSYGTHCIPALDAFYHVIYYLAVILKVFQRSTAKDLQKVFKWIDDVMDSLFVKKPVLYLIETKKINAIIRKARNDLSPYLTKPEYDVQVPLQSKNIKNDIYREFLKMLKNFEWDMTNFLLTIDYVLATVLRKEITKKSLYIGYSLMIRAYLERHHPKVARFISNQSNYIRRDVEAMVQQEFEEAFEKPKVDLKNGSGKADSSEKQEPKEQENMPSCSTENAENRDQQLGEELEKLEIEKNKIEKLEEEKAHLKTANKQTDSDSDVLMKEDDREDLKRKVGLLTSEIEKLRAEKCKNAEFQQNTKKRVDSINSRLQRVIEIIKSSYHPATANLDKMMIDVLELKDLLDECVEKEHDKLED